MDIINILRKEEDLVKKKLLAAKRLAGGDNRHRETFVRILESLIDKQHKAEKIEEIADENLRKSVKKREALHEEQTKLLSIGKFKELADKVHDEEQLMKVLEHYEQSKIVKTPKHMPKAAVAVIFVLIIGLLAANCTTMPIDSNKFQEPNGKKLSEMTQSELKSAMIEQGFVRADCSCFSVGIGKSPNRNDAWAMAAADSKIKYSEECLKKDPNKEIVYLSAGTTHETIWDDCIFTSGAYECFNIIGLTEKNCRNNK
jgi:hypothetical protein